MRKGQGAMEYLMTYGWALLVIIIVGAALFALGVLNPATYQQRRCTGFQYFTYMDQKADDGTPDVFTIQLRNGVNDMNVSSIKVGGVTAWNNSIDMNLSGEGGWTGSGATSSAAGWLGQGKVLTVIGVVPNALSSGTYDDLLVTVTYNVKNGIQGNTDTATCVGSAV